MRTIFTIFFRDIKRLCSNWVAVLVVLGVCLIPSLYAWFNICLLYTSIKGGTFPVVVCYLDKGEQMITEKGSMVWQTPNFKMETSGGGLEMCIRDRM